MQWRVHDDEPELARRLAEAGFTAGPQRAVLVAEVRALAKLAGRRDVHGADHRALERVRALAVGSGPHRTPFAQFHADGRPAHCETWILVRERHGRVVSACWAELVAETEFLAVGGVTGDVESFLPELAAWAQATTTGIGFTSLPVRYLLAEATGVLGGAWQAAGFRQVGTVTTYRWVPSGEPAGSRPVKRLFAEPQHDEIWDRFDSDFRFRPGVECRPAVAEPPDSVTWHLGAVGDGADDTAGDRLQEIIERGLRACARPGEWLYWLDWNHQGYRFDPSRVGDAGQPRWPGAAFPDGDYYLYLTPDLRLGTFGHPWEESLCVVGADLLTAVEDDLTALLGRVLRRGGRNVGNPLPWRRGGRH